MNSSILNKNIQEYIFEISESSLDLNTLILSGSPFDMITIQELAQQISGRRKAKQKLPSWFNQEGIYYPPMLNLEQTSSEAAAAYKSNLVQGDRLIDLTGGFGIDDFFFSKHITQVIHCELNQELSQITAHNFKTLGAENISCHIGDGLEILKHQGAVDWIYIDPSRRHDSKGKVFFLEDCLPNIPEHLTFLFSKSQHILIKTSPLLDIQVGIASLKHVKEIHVIAVQHEVKELLWVLDAHFMGDVHIQTINITKNGDQKFSFGLKDEATIQVSLEFPKKFLYEPNPAILKSGGFLSISRTYQLEKLHLHSHLYTSEALIDFPGRRFEIISVIPYQKKTLAKAGISKANITTRNFPDNVANLRKKFKIKDGGEEYLFFTTNCTNEKVVLRCRKV